MTTTDSGPVKMTGGSIIVTAISRTCSWEANGTDFIPVP